MRVFLMITVAAVLSLPVVTAASTPYDIGTPTLTELWVDPVSGADTNSGASRAQALRTLTAAWNLIPATMSATGYRVNLLPGAFPCEPLPENRNNCVNFFSDKQGTRQFPVIIRAIDGPGTATIRGGMNIDRVSHLYLLDLNMVAGGPVLPTNSSYNNLLHLANSDHILLRGLDLRGPSCTNEMPPCENNLQEVLKVNQVQHLYVEDSAIGGCWHSSVDFMVVQYGHLLNNSLHTAGQWCMYAKGGSAYLAVENNELANCQLGFEAGEASNLAMMTPPWLHYETYDVKFVNNILRDIPGEGFNAHGCYNCLFAHNTLYNVGTDQASGYPLFRADQGERNCTPTEELQLPVPVCRQFLTNGGWGPNFETASAPVIPNRNVFIYNNLFYNPAGNQTLYSHLMVRGPLTPPPGFLGMPVPAVNDTGLRIRGNVIWNGPADHPLGIEEPGEGCQPANSSCNAVQLRADNLINIAEPQLIDPAHGDFHPRPDSPSPGSSYAIPDFSWSDIPASPAVPAGNLVNAVPVDREGRTVAGVPPGAFRTTDGFPVRRVFGTTYEYAATPQQAVLKVSANGERILMKSGSYGQLTLDRPWSFSLEGGYDSGFAAGAGAFSTIVGSLSLTAGSTVLKNIVVR